MMAYQNKATEKKLAFSRGLVFCLILLVVLESIVKSQNFENYKR